MPRRVGSRIGVTCKGCVRSSRSSGRASDRCRTSSLRQSPNSRRVWRSSIRQLTAGANILIDVLHLLQERLARVFGLLEPRNERRQVAAERDRLREVRHLSIRLGQLGSQPIAACRSVPRREVLPHAGHDAIRQFRAQQV
jgi:hypothetical protein